MNKDDYKRILEEALEPIKGQLNNVEVKLNNVETKLSGVEVKLNSVEHRLDDPKSGLKRINEKLDALWDQTAKLTEDNDDLKKVENRVSQVEKHLGISQPS